MHVSGVVWGKSARCSKGLEEFALGIEGEGRAEVFRHPIFDFVKIVERLLQRPELHAERAARRSARKARDSSGE